MGAALSKDEASLPFAYASAASAPPVPPPQHTATPTQALNIVAPMGLAGPQEGQQADPGPQPQRFSHSHSLDDVFIAQQHQQHQLQQGGDHSSPDRLRTFLRSRLFRNRPPGDAAQTPTLHSSASNQDLAMAVNSPSADRKMIENGDDPTAFGYDDVLEDCDEQLDDSILMNQRSLRPITFGQLTSLAVIGLCKQDLMFMSPNMGLLFMTTTLELCCNNLTRIPPEIGYMKSLTVLSVSKNRLTSLPETIGYLTKLVEFRASDNEITELPQSMGELTKLCHLHLASNKIEALPGEVGQMVSLVTLDLSNNPLRALPAEVGRLKFLRKLLLENCALLSSFEVEEVRSPPSLKELAARVIVRQQVPILEVTQDDVKNYLASAHACSFCGGPYFETFFLRGKIIEKSADVHVPFEYRLCVPHWDSETERITALFCPPPITAPAPISSANMHIYPTPPASPGQHRHHRSSSTSGVSFSSSSYTTASPGISNLGTLPVSSLSKTPSLPSLPGVSSPKGLRARILRKSGLLPKSRSLSFLPQT